MPLTKSEDHGTEKDGSKNEKYCHYCFQNGKFTSDMSLDEMIEVSAKGWSDQDQKVSLMQARAQMKHMLPYLERWRKN
jgi:hypothetical protein